MTLITICSAKHSPGVTTLGQALALQTGALFIEADPAGGDLAARWGVPTDPGMLTLAAASRRGVSRDLIDRHGQSMPESVEADAIGEFWADSRELDELAVGFLIRRFAEVGEPLFGA